MKKYLSILLLGCFFHSGVNAAEIKACKTEQCVEYFKQYKKYANSGYADALSTLGEFYFHGYGTDVDLDLALKNYRRGAKYGSFNAQYKAGLMYLEVEEYKDIDDGISYLKKAARNKHAVSAYLLGMLYSNGQYIKANYDEADEWLTKAYETRNAIVVNQINTLTRSENFDIKRFPELSAVINNADHQSDSNINWNDSDGTETITITSPDLITLLDQEIEVFKNTNPQRFAVTTGTSINSRSCDKVFSCGTVDAEDYKRLLLYTNF